VTADKTSPRGDSPTRSRRRRIAAGGVAVLVVAVLAVLVVQAGRDAGRPEASASTAPVTSGPAAESTHEPEPTTEPEPATAVVPGPTEGGDAPPALLPAVDIDEQADAGDGLTASVRSIEAIQGAAFGPGNIAGPALRVTVRLQNGTGAPVALDGVAVDLSTGVEATPASPLEDRSRSPFSGTVAAGDTADGVYVFTVPTDRRDLVTVSVGYRPGAPLMVFTGSL
jgi:hypothetical protein